MSKEQVKYEWPEFKVGIESSKADESGDAKEWPDDCRFEEEGY